MWSRAERGTALPARRAIRRLVCGAAIAALTGGCSGTGVRQTTVEHHEMVSRIELVARDVPQSRWPQLLGQAALEEAPEWAALGYADAAMELKGGRDRRLVFPHPGGLGPLEVTTRRAQPDRMFLFDRDWRLIGQVRVPEQGAGGEVLSVGGEWDAQGRRLAAWARTESAFHVGLVDLDSAELSTSLRFDRVAGQPVEQAPHLLWRGDSLIFYCQADNERYGSENVVLEVDPAGRGARRVLTEERWDPSRGPFHEMAVSPDGRFLAFDRTRSPTLMAMAGRCSGIWLLDLDSGECVELTSEDEGDYEHRLVGWEDGRKLSFARRVPPPEGSPVGDVLSYDLYRAHLRTEEGDR